MSEGANPLLPGPGPADDEVLAALADVMAALEQTSRRNEQALAKGSRISRQRAEGRPWREIVADEERPLVVELVTENLQALTDAGARLRRAQARALHREGVTMGQIAELFGVTRQRVSHLIRPRGQSSTGRRSGRRGARRQDSAE